jgi:restriction system protein
MYHLEDDDKSQPDQSRRPRPVVDEEYYDSSQYASLIASWEERHRQAVMAAIAAATTGSREEYVPDFPVLVSQTVIIPHEKTDEGQLIKAATFPLLAIIERIMKDPSLMYEVDPRKWEEIIAATYDESGLFDEVTLTPRSGDRGRDVIAVKRGFGSVRLIESVKRHTPGTKTTAEEVQALLGVLLSDPQASKGIVSTTWEFAPMIWENLQITQYIPHRLELVDGKALLKRLNEYTTPKSK